jgi:hypothetical protein
MQNQNEIALIQIKQDQNFHDKRRIDDELAEKQKRTLEMFFTWSSIDMFKIKSEIQASLQKVQTTDRKYEVFLLKISDDYNDRTNYYSIHTITQFMSDLTVMIEFDLIDKPLCYRIFDQSIQSWCDLYDNIIFAPVRARGESLWSAAVNQLEPEFKKEERWHRNSVAAMRRALSSCEIGE